MPFNFTRLHGIFSQALKQHQTTIAFELQQETGRFVFMMFLADEAANTTEGNGLPS